MIRAHFIHMMLNFADIYRIMKREKRAYGALVVNSTNNFLWYSLFSLWFFMYDVKSTKKFLDWQYCQQNKYRPHSLDSINFLRINAIYWMNVINHQKPFHSTDPILILMFLSFQMLCSVQSCDKYSKGKKICCGGESEKEGNKDVDYIQERVWDESVAAGYCWKLGSIWRKLWLYGLYFVSVLNCLEFNFAQ